MSVDDQLPDNNGQYAEEYYDLPKMAQNSAYFFYEQKVLAENPKLDPASYYEGNFDKTALNSLKDRQPTTRRCSRMTFNTNRRRHRLRQHRLRRDGDSSLRAGSSRTSAAGLYNFNDGSTGREAAYAPDADCEWTLTAISTYVNIEITKLMSEHARRRARGLRQRWRPPGDVHRPVGPDQTAGDPLK